MERIITAIQNEAWEEALNLFVDYTSGKELDDKRCVLGASILEHFDDRDDRFGLIRSGLRINMLNYELYLLLGNFYIAENKEKALLCYENALYYAKKSGSAEDISVIESIIAEYISEANVTLSDVSFLIVADDDEQSLDRCVNCIEETCGLGTCDIQIIKTTANESYVDKLNEAIKDLNEDNDVFLLSSDVYLTPNSLFNLRMGLYEDKRIGAVSAVSNIAFDFQVLTAAQGVDSYDNAVKLAGEINIPGGNVLENKVLTWTRTREAKRPFIISRCCRMPA